MSSVLAIVSKALFEKMIPKSEALIGAVVDTSEYVSKNKTFASLKEGGAIFLVTVRPPDEKLWLVGILENPKKKGDKWKAPSNEAPLTDITSAIKKLKLQSGAGISAKKGSLGMSLQTPRALADGDVELLRAMVARPSGKKVHASKAYAKAVDEVVHKKAARKKTSRSGELGKYRIENPRTPFRDSRPKDLEEWEKDQLRSLFPKGTDIDKYFGYKPTGDDELVDLAVEMQFADVIDTTSGKVAFQVMVTPLGDGCVVENRKTKIVARIAQSGLDPRHKQPQSWVRDFGLACMEARKRLDMADLPFFKPEQLAEDS